MKPVVSSIYEYIAATEATTATTATAAIVATVATTATAATVAKAGEPTKAATAVDIRFLVVMCSVVNVVILALIMK